ncbi:MAG: urate hydroxylase PuuD [Acidobacteria bacterium]|nr:urate hydroxylase PuuD [Acidobacteriota bacterium]
MDFNFSEWLNLGVRWVHVFAGILWIGQTYFFTWLDGRLGAAERDKQDGGPAKVWLVHSGGFYVVEKHALSQFLPPRLRWFRWEAAITWLSGMVLLVLVYYLGGALVDSDVAEISVGAGVGIGVALLVGGWFVYDLIWQSPLGKAEKSAAALCFLLLVGVTFGLTQVFSGRGAYMHVGALLGTLMAANVWLRILPAQRQLIAAAQAGRQPKSALVARAKLRTKHNTYMVVPVVFVMVSNHFPVATYGHRYNWAILVILILAGWGAAHILRRA